MSVDNLNRRFSLSMQGFTLIEVMVALLIFAIGIIPLISMCGNTIRLTGKADTKIIQEDFARELLDAAISGTLGEAEHEGMNAYLWQGKDSNGIKWQVKAEPWSIDGDIRRHNAVVKSDWYLYRVSFASINFSTIAPLSMSK